MDYPFPDNMGGLIKLIATIKYRNWNNQLLQ